MYSCKQKFEQNNAIAEFEPSIMKTQSEQDHFRNAMLCMYPPNLALMLRNAPSFDDKTIAKPDQSPFEEREPEQP
jgi:membrane-bound lytic murein transglycosylase